jgi:serine/threonine protein kinase
MSAADTPADETLDDRLDRIVGDYADALAAGRAPDPRVYLQQAPARVRPGLERCLKMIAASGADSPDGAPVVPQPLLPGVSLDGFKLVRELGRGGMAVVWLAHDQQLARPVAIKVLRPGLAYERRHVDRFRREALAMARLAHSGVVRVISVGNALGHAYIAMEYVEGPSLATVLGALPPAARRTPQDLARAAAAPNVARGVESFEAALARLLAPVAAALAAAHAEGLVHRDVKPSNILLRADGSPVLCDFGLAKGGEDPALSLTGEPLGTPYYMSPEQAALSEHEVDHRTDVYSLGVTLYEALAGRRPFDGANALEVMQAIRTQLPPSLTALVPASAVTRDADAVVRRAMARDPERRYASAGELAAELTALAEGRATRARMAEGGRLRRAWTQLRFATSGQLYDYRSARTFLGLPLVHAIGGPRPPGAPRRVARGWIALGGERAIGLVAMSAEAYGGIAFGAFAVGGFTWSGIGLGLVTFCGIGLGLVSFSGLAVAWFAIGGVALGYGAIGGLAVGSYALGGKAYGTHSLDGMEQDQAAREFFAGVLPGFLQNWLPPAGG